MLRPALHQLTNLGTIHQVVRLASKYWLWSMVVLVGSVVFFGSPGDYAGTSRAVLHGLCAQTPSHTLSFNGRMLPFDSRMTGIYGGFLVTIVMIVAKGRLFFYGNPPIPVISVLIGLVGFMAIDGFNSMLMDLGLWHPYLPSNALRVITGYGVGIALAVGLSWLLASSVWNLSSPRIGIAQLSDLRTPVAGLVAYGALLIARPSWLHFPISLLLVVSAWITITMLMLVIVLLASRLDATIRSVQALHVPVATAALLAVSAMLALAGIRFWVEQTFGIPNAMM